MTNGASQPGSAASASSERSGHGSPSARRRNMIRSRHCFRCCAPRQASEPKRQHAARQRQRGRLVRRNRQRLLGEHERAEPAATPRPQGRGGAIEGQFVHGLDRRAGDSFDLAKRKRRGEEDARRSRAAGDLADGEERLAGERVMRLDRRRPPVRHQEFAALAIARRRRASLDARCDRSDRPRRAGRRRASSEPASPATFSRCGRRVRIPLSPSGRGGAEGVRARRRQPPREPPRVLGPRRAVAAEGLEPGRKIDRVAAEPALGQDDRDLARRPRVARPRGVDHHPRQTRRQREAGNRAALVGDAAIAVERANGVEQRLRLGERCRAAADRGRRSVAGSATPQSAQSSAKPERSAERISGAA